MEIFFTSDQHFYHSNVIRYCGRPWTKNVTALGPNPEQDRADRARMRDVEEMNEELIRNYNSVIGPNDICYHVGDFSLAFRPVELYTRRLLGKKVLIAGNHDWCSPAHKKSRNEKNREVWTQKYKDAGWDDVKLQMVLDIPGVATVNVAHMPYLEVGGDEDQRHGKHRIPDDGRWLLCGHVHEKWLQRKKMINVGVDQWNFRPVHIDEISKLILAEGT